MACTGASGILVAMLPTATTTDWLRVAPLVITTAAALAVAWAIVRWKARDHERRVELWRKFALDNRLQLTVQPDSFLRLGGLTIRGRIGEIELLLETYRVRVGKSTQVWIRAQSKAEGQAGRFSIQRRSLLTRFGGLFGVRGVSIDGADFDQQFLVRSEPIGLAAAALDEPTRKHFARLTQSPRLEYADGNIELNWRCGAESSEQLDDAVEMHARLRGALQRAGQRGAS